MDALPWHFMHWSWTMAKPASDDHCACAAPQNSRIASNGAMRDAIGESLRRREAEAYRKSSGREQELSALLRPGRGALIIVGHVFMPEETWPTTTCASGSAPWRRREN